jgi:hypothetical protein
VHLAVFAQERSIRIQDRAGIVVDAGGAAFEQGNYQRDFLFLGDLREFFGRGASLARWLHGAPIRRACGSRERSEFSIVERASLGERI